MSRLTRLSLANRAVIALVTAAIAVFGVVSLGSLKQELIPSLQIPTVAVVAASPGSSPDLVEQQVTEPLEAALSGITGVEQLESTASSGLSTTTVMLTYGTDTGDAAQDIQRALDRAATTLPAEVEPVVVTGSIDDLPVVQLAVTGGDGATVDPAFVTTLNQQVLPRLQEIEGVRDVTLTGTTEALVTVDLDLAAATAAGVSPAAVTTLLQDYGVALPAGTVDDGDRTLSVQVGAPLTSVDDLRALPLTSATGAAVTLGDVASVTESAAEPTSYSRLDGDAALGIAITKTPDGNTVDVSHGVTEALDELAPVLGGGQVAVVFDQAPFIEESIEGLATEGGLGLLFAVVVILVFLASIASTLVSAISIPLSLLVTFIGLQVSGYSLNILTLGAMTVAIGRVVDDSIVVIENIKRHLSYGEGKQTAILTAVREVAGAITASTVTTVAVFLPIGLVGGMVGELFRPFALTVAIAMTASLLVALTIVPVLAYWFLRAPKSADRERAELAERSNRMQRGYLAALRTALAHPVWTIGIAVAVLGVPGGHVARGAGRGRAGGRAAAGRPGRCRDGADDGRLGRRCRGVLRRRWRPVGDLRADAGRRGRRDRRAGRDPRRRDGRRRQHAQRVRRRRGVRQLDRRRDRAGRRQRHPGRPHRAGRGGGARRRRHHRRHQQPGRAAADRAGRGGPGRRRGGGAHRDPGGRHAGRAAQPAGVGSAGPG
jgi:multidrug efflux pump subunit AcrB